MILRSTLLLPNAHVPFTHSRLFTRQIKREDGAACGCSGDNLHGSLNEWGLLEFHDEKGCQCLNLSGKSVELSE